VYFLVHTSRFAGVGLFAGVDFGKKHQQKCKIHTSKMKKAQADS
jgi:hypothetical protein